jgi:uncharacterized membrane protein
VAYDQWTQFDQFPRFMEGVERVAVQPDGTLEWTAVIDGQHRRWWARIVELLPDRLVAWRSDGGVLDGSAEFIPGRPGQCRIVVDLERRQAADPEDLGARLEADLARFKTFIEGRHGATGSWRREFHEGSVGKP